MHCSNGVCMVMRQCLLRAAVSLCTMSTYGICVLMMCLFGMHTHTVSKTCMPPPNFMSFLYCVPLYSMSCVC